MNQSNNDLQQAFFNMLQSFSTEKEIKHISLNEIYKQWMFPKQLKLSPDTINYYNKIHSHLDSYFLNKNIHSLQEINIEEINNFIINERNRNVSNNTIKKHIDQLKYYFDFAFKKKLINNNPFIDFDPIRKDETKILIVDTKLIIKIFNYLDSLNLDDNINLRNSLMLHLYLDTGCRRTELHSITINNINLNDNSIFLAKTKTRKCRYVFFSEKNKKTAIKILITSKS